MRPNKSQKSVFVRIVKAPVRALCRARDFYVRSMGSCAASVGHGNLGGPGGGHAALPRSFSVGSWGDDSDDFRELLRAASLKTLGQNPPDIEILLKGLKSMEENNNNGNNSKVGSKMSKSCSVGMGRIDEDKAYEFQEEGKLSNEGHPVGPGKVSNLYSKRSKSYADGASRVKVAL